MTFWLEFGLFVVVGIAAADLVVHLVYSVIALRQFESRPSFHVLSPPSDAPIPEPIEFPTTNGLKLRGGIYFPDVSHPRGVVLFCPETGGTFDTVMNYAQATLDAGYIVASFSFRNETPSDSLPEYRSNYWVTQYEVDDVHAALDFIAGQPQFYGLPVGLMGISRGAGAALAAGATRADVASIWVQGAFSTKGLSVHHALKFVKSMIGRAGNLIPVWHVRVTIWFMLHLLEYRNRCQLIELEALLPYWQDRQIMFVSGSRDTYVPTYLTDQLRELTGHEAHQSQWIVPQAKHNLERETSPVEFDQRIVQFFDRNALPQERIGSGKSMLAK